MDTKRNDSIEEEEPETPKKVDHKSIFALVVDLDM
jgi:hypothetical protein